MSTTLLKYNVTLIVLCIGMTLIHNSSGEKVIKNINLYYDPISSPCRAVLLTLEALNLQFNLINIRLYDKNQLEDNFRTLNSLHTVPVIQDDNFVLSESHAIILYLVQEYGKKDDPLYPNSSKLQAKVHEKLYYDSSYLYPAFKIQYTEWIFYRINKTQEGEIKIHDILKNLEDALEKSPWVAGDSMTVADFSLVASISTFKVAGVDLTRYSKINEWFEKCSTTMVGYDIANQKGIDEYDVMLKSLDDKSEDIPKIYQDL